MTVDIGFGGISRPSARDIAGIFGQEPPAGLSPIGDSGWYVTPDEPADPRDCDRYPDSPWCGGNPIDRTTPIGIGVDFGISRCGVHVTANPVLGYVKLPPVSLAYMREECRYNYEHGWKQGLENFQAGTRTTPLILPDSIPPEAEVMIGINHQWTTQTSSANRITGAVSESFNSRLWTVSPVEFPSARKETILVNNRPSLELGRFRQVDSFSYSNSLGESGSFGNDYIDAVYQNLNQPDFWNARIFFENRFFDGYRCSSEWQAANWTHPSLVALGKYGAIREDFKRLIPSAAGKTVFVDSDSDRIYISINVLQYSIAFIKFKKPEDGQYKIPPFLDPRRERKCCVSCCPQNSNQANRNQADNREILRLLREIRKYQGNYPQKLEIFDANEDKQGAQKKTLTINNSAEFHKLNGEQVQKSLKMIGIDIFPLKLPKTIVEKKGGNIFEKALDFLNPFDNEEINSLAEWQVWYTKQFNAVMGQWMEEIQVEDADPEKKGNQRETVVLPNIAMTMKEQFMMQAQSMKILGLIFDMFLKTMVELAGIKAKSAEACAQIQEIVDFLDYPTNQKSIDVPVQITIPKPDATREEINNIEKFLKNSTIKVIYDDWTGEGSLHDFLLDLSQMAASQRAQNAAL